MDTMNITVLDNGDLKIETDRVSPANHMTAEAFMRNVAQVCGGKQERRHKHGIIGAAAHAVQHALGREH